MHLKHLAPLALLVPAVLADGASILAAISDIRNATVSLGSTIGSWDGGLLAAVPIVVESTSLLATIKASTGVAEESEQLSILEAAKVYLATTTLVKDVNATLTTVVGAKDKFDRLLLSPLILLNLELERGASAEFSGAVVEKLPEALKETGEGLALEIEEAFGWAIGVYNPFG